MKYWMNTIEKIIILTFFLLSGSWGQNSYPSTDNLRYGINGGKFTKNVIFKDMDGNTFDTYKLLNEGKVIGFTFAWPS